MPKWMHRSRMGFVLLALAFAAAGCGRKKAPEAPLEEVKLLDRMCIAMRAQRYDEALAILDKLDTISPDDAILGEMRLRLVSNSYVQKIQAALDRNDPEGALKLADEAVRTNPSVSRFKVISEELGGIVQLRKAARRLSAAGTASELAAALIAVDPLAAAHPEAKQLAADIKARRADLAKMRAEEAARKQKKTVPAPSPAPVPPAKP